MAYIYLLKLYETIDQRIDNAELSIKNLPDDSPDTKNQKIKHIEGRIQTLKEFKKFLFDNLNIKLPRRIRKQFKNL